MQNQFTKQRERASVKGQRKSARRRMGIIQSAKSSGTFGVLFALVFLASGLVVNFFQLLSCIFLWPFSRDSYRFFNAYLVNFYWSEMVWCAEWWAGVDVKIYGDEQTQKSIGRDSGIALCNHRSDVDWLFGWVIAQKFGCLGGAKAMMKSSSKFLPVLGWSWWFLEYVFLNRDWTRDETVLQKMFAELRTFPLPYWMVIFAEGTRFTEEKHKQSLKFAAEKGLPQLKYHLLPKTKGFVYTFQHLRDGLQSVYDVTFMFPTGKQPTVSSLLQAKPGEVHILVRRFDPKALPTDDKDLAKWCLDLYVAKDGLLEEHERTQTLEGKYRLMPLRKDPFPWYVMTGWTIACITGFILYVARLIAGGHWIALAVTVTLLLASTIVVRIWVTFSQAKRSSTARAAAAAAAKKAD